MPTRLLLAYAAKLPAISAEESLLAVERAAIGGGLGKSEDRLARLREWQRQAGQATAAKVKDAGMMSKVAQASGIAFRTVKGGRRG